MTTETIIVERRGRVGIVRLNRPQALNALNSALNAELSRALAAFDADGAIGDESTRKFLQGFADQFATLVARFADPHRAAA